ncbi:hypothetical protein HELRODRAFT_75957 [Helobdella robusta]|uniref:L-Fucosyltransferase n=1 Tax=Helobdella robusta TaxID=6412 RepID=T1G2D2_HELRO|nr:hypothetical protein HELRODRAFT_75957 [Helobdella robusta]ESO07645.1 hypothetical protein HELRODRAFT_75957 [Helobdella robusta]
MKFPKCSASYLKDGLSALTFHEANYAKYDPLVNNLPANHHIILDRFFQSWKYFNVENEFIRNTVFKFHKDIDFAAEQRLKQGLKYLEKEKCKHPCFDVKIAVHIRRKNLDQKHLRDLGYTTPPIEYYKNAMEFFLKKYKYLKSVFVVSSDDLKWAKFNLVSITDRLIFIQSNHPAIDMAILSKCNHTIISVGTFGWWSAWLANGTTVYYKDWPVVGSSLYESTNHADYFPSSWIPM